MTMHVFMRYHVYVNKIWNSKSVSKIIYIKLYFVSRKLTGQFNKYKGNPLCESICRVLLPRTTFPLSTQSSLQFLTTVNPLSTAYFISSYILYHLILHLVSYYLTLCFMKSYILFHILLRTISHCLICHSYLVSYHLTSCIILSYSQQGYHLQPLLILSLIMLSQPLAL